MAKAQAARAADLDDDDRDDAPIQRSRSTAGSKPPPATTAPASVFAMGAAAKPKRAAPERLDLSQISIRRGVPIPDAEPPRRESAYLQLLKRMRPGDMVELSTKQAYSLLSQAKKHQVAVTRRKLGEDNYGIWIK